MDNYRKIARENIDRLYADLPEDLSENLPARRQGDCFIFKAFGETCRITPEGIHLGNGDLPSVLGVIISLYALNARPDACSILPFKAFREFDNSAPYVGAFTTHTEQILVPHVEAIRENLSTIRENLGTADAHEDTHGDFSLVVRPLPKIVLSYIFYEADDDFPASATCLYSSNSEKFLPVDAMADVGEYTSKKIIQLAGK